MNLYNPTALFTLLFLLIPSLAAPGPAAREVAPRAAAASVKYCDPKTTVCWSQYTSAAGVQYRLAVDDTAKAGAAFPVVLQIVAPKAVGWAGICFGGAMANNPLAIGWANGAKAMVSSRRSASTAAPGAYTGATYTMIDSLTNATHWSVTATCTGCSAWAGAKGLDPASTAQPLAMGECRTAPTAPASDTTKLAEHSATAKWTHDMTAGVNKGLSALLAAAAAGNKAAGTKA